MFVLDFDADTFANLNYLAGLFVPLIVALLANPTTPRYVKQLLAIAVSIVVGLFVTASQQGIYWRNIDEVIRTTVAVVGVAQTTYVLLWKSVGRPVTKRLEQFTLIRGL